MHIIIVSLEIFLEHYEPQSNIQKANVGRGKKICLVCWPRFFLDYHDEEEDEGAKKSFKIAENHICISLKAKYI